MLGRTVCLLCQSDAARQWGKSGRSSVVGNILVGHPGRNLLLQGSHALQAADARFNLKLAVKEEAQYFYKHILAICAYRRVVHGCMRYRSPVRAHACMPWHKQTSASHVCAVLLMLLNAVPWFHCMVDTDNMTQVDGSVLMCQWHGNGCSGCN